MADSDRTFYAFLIAVQLPDVSQEKTDQSLEELQALATTLGFQVAGTSVQPRLQIHPRSYVGSGKIEEIRAAVKEKSIDLVIADANLSPKQAQHLSKSLKCEVFDRTQLILEIFQQNAKTRESKLQVELARLQYMLPRLVGMWRHLDRERGGVGVSRGTGEKQIEIDRRWVSHRISYLKKAIEQVTEERHTQKKRRNRDCLNVCLIGYTNAGKSTIMNGLTSAGKLAENKLFATLESTTRTLDEGSAPKILLSDTVGFIKNLPHELVASFQSTLEVIKDADLLLHVVDVGADYEEHLETTQEVLKEINALTVPRLLVFNKVDKLERPMDLILLKKKYSDAVFISAEQGGVDELQQQVIQFFEFKMETIQICLDYQSASNLSKVYQWGRVDEIDYKDDGIHLTLTSIPQNIKRLEHHLGDALIKESA